MTYFLNPMQPAGERSPRSAVTGKKKPLCSGSSILVGLINTCRKKEPIVLSGAFAPRDIVEKLGGSRRKEYIVRSGCFEKRSMDPAGPCRNQECIKKAIAMQGLTSYAIAGRYHAHLVLHHRLGPP
jgi:hypothetical protein